MKDVLDLVADDGASLQIVRRNGQLTIDFENPFDADRRTVGDVAGRGDVYLSDECLDDLLGEPTILDSRNLNDSMATRGGSMPLALDLLIR